MKSFWLFVCLLSIVCVSFVKASYVEEYPSAYVWAYDNWVTTKDTIEKANMYWEITRIELSKMISNYAINVLKKRQDISKNCDFVDISNELNLSYDLWVVKACQLWLMWQWITKFRPYDKVTRAEFWTILSRLLYWDKYNGWTPYYIKHINNLNIRWIMTNISSVTWNEVRGNVMVMLKRSQELWNYKISTFEELSGAAFQCNFCYLDGCFDEDIDKKWFIIPYKDWYIWYDWLDDGLWDARLNLTYRKVDDPCEVVYKTEDVFHYNYNNTPCILSYWYSEKTVEKFSFKEKDIRKCMDEQEKYFYKLIVWLENDEIFTLWMNLFKKNIDSNSFSKNWRSKYYECMENTKREDFKDVDIEDFMTETTFDADGYMKEIKEYNTKKAEYWYLCLKEILKN